MWCVNVRSRYKARFCMVLRLQGGLVGGYHGKTVAEKGQLMGSTH